MRLLKKKAAPTPISARPATPPTTPPAIAPVGVPPEEVEVGVGLALAVELTFGNSAESVGLLDNADEVKDGTGPDVDESGLQKNRQKSQQMPPK